MAKRRAQSGTVSTDEVMRAMTRVESNVTLMDASLSGPGGMRETVAVLGDRVAHLERFIMWSVGVGGAILSSLVVIVVKDTLHIG